VRKITERLGDVLQMRRQVRIGEELHHSIGHFWSSVCYGELAVARWRLDDAMGVVALLHAALRAPRFVILTLAATDAEHGLVKLHTALLLFLACQWNECRKLANARWPHDAARMLLLVGIADAPRDLDDLLRNRVWKFDGLREINAD
jgi:hypothetical protein